MVDSRNHGSYPEPQHAVRINAQGKSVHLFSPKIPVTADATYMIKSFLRVEASSDGMIGYYVDEYDKHDKWVSGQWKTSEPNPFVENINISYKPTSTAVHKARLQIYTANGPVKAYIDSLQWFPLTK